MEQGKQVWVAFANPEQQFHIAVAFIDGMTALQAIQNSGLADQVSLPEPLQLGVFGSRIEAETILQAGDRVEVYRALTINPKDIRRKRAKANPTSKYCRSNRFKQLN